MLLADNSFPEYAIEDALHRCEGLEKGRHRKKDSEKVTLKLPFLSDKLNQRLRSIVRQSKLPLRIVHERGRKFERPAGTFRFFTQNMLNTRTVC